MPWKGVTVSEQSQRFLEDYPSNYFSAVELTENFGVSRKAANKWIDRFKEYGHDSYHERSYRLPLAYSM